MLYYFTIEGCEEASYYNHTFSKDTFTISTEDDVIPLKPITLTKVSTRVISNNCLTFPQLSVTKVLLLEHMEAQDWSEDHVVPLAESLSRLESHKTRQISFGNAALLTYQAEMQCNWHKALSSYDAKSTFDISIINEEHLNHTWTHLINEGSVIKSQR